MPIVRDQSPIVFSLFTRKGGLEQAPILLTGIALCLVAFIIQCSPASCETFTAPYWLQKGDAFYANDSYELAVKCYDKALEIDSKYFLAWYNKGRSLFNMGQFEEANQAYDRALEINLASSEAWNNKGRALYELDRYEESYDAQRKALEIDPQNPDAWYDEGKSLDMLSEYSASNEAYSKALEIDPGNADAWNRTGYALYKLWRYNESDQALDRALEIDPFNAYAWYKKGEVLRTLGRFNESEDAFQKSLEINLLDAEAWTTKGDALKGLARNGESNFAYNEANRIYDGIVRNDEGNADAWKKKGEVLYKLGNYFEGSDSLMEAFDNYNNINPDQLGADILSNKLYILKYIYSNFYRIRVYSPNNYTHIYFNNTYYNKSELRLEVIAAYEDALKLNNETIKMNPLNEDAWNTMGDVLSSLDRFNESKAAYAKTIEIYDTKLKKDSRNASLWFGKGEVLGQLNDYKGSEQAYAEAFRIYNDILQSDPHNIMSLYNCGKVLYKLNRYHDSDIVYTEALKIRKQPVFELIKGKDSKDVLNSSDTSRYWIKRGDHYSGELAIKCYDKAIEIDPKSAIAWNNKGQAIYDEFSDSGHYRQALSCYDQAIKIDPLYAEAWANRADILSSLGKKDDAHESYMRANEIAPSRYNDQDDLLETSSTARGSSKKEIDGNAIAAFVIIYLIIIILYANILKIKRFPKQEFFIYLIKKQVVKWNIYMPLKVLKFIEFLFILSILSIPIIIITFTTTTNNHLIEAIFIASLLTILVLGFMLIGAIITVVLWMLFSTPLTPCGYRAIWADLEQQNKNRLILNRLNYIAIAYFFISGIIAVYIHLSGNYKNDAAIAGTLLSWILVASLVTILPSVMSVILCKNLDRQTAKSVFISQFGLIGINGFWLSVLIYIMAEYYSSLKEWTSDFNILFILVLMLFCIICLLIPYLQGLRRAEKQREKLYATRQKWLDALSGILEIPAPALYISKLEQFLKDLEDERASFIENDEMVKLGVNWDKNENNIEESEDLGNFKCQIMREAYKKSRDLDPRFLHLDFLESLRIHVGECIEQLNLAGKKGDSELIQAASDYAEVYHSKKEEITKIIEQDRQIKPRWTVALATIITLILTPILNEFGKFISGMMPLK